jgi:hypothetical protein
VGTPVVAEAQAQRDEKERAATQAVRERLTPLARLLNTIPIEIQREGFSLASLQASLRGRHRGNCHPGELGVLYDSGDGMTMLAFAHFRI